MNHALNAQYVLRRVPVNHEQTILVDDQNLNDIVAAIKHYHQLHKKQYDDISENFWQENAADTAKVLYDFCKKYIHYKVEPENNQTIKSPGRMIDEGMGDCKHYSSFINGVVDSLNRKGYPINCCYRFVSDEPGMDVHHVFAIVKGSGKNYWVDPVLSGFDSRPDFFNTKDVHFNNGIGKLSYLSGTDAEMGKISFKKAWQGIKKDVKKIEHGVENVADEVKHVGLKVGLSTARNAFLALLDINGFHLAAGVHNSLKGPKRNGLLHKWKDMGGNPNKLIAAANNGIKFHNKLHKKHQIHGLDGCAGMGAVVHTQHISTHPQRWVNEYFMPHHRRRMRHLYVDPHGRLRHRDTHAMVSGAMVGVEPISTATLITLASGIVAALSKFIDMKKGTSEAIADAAKEGGLNIAQQAAAADGGDDDAKNKTAAALTPGGGDATMSIKTGTDQQGQPEVTVQDVKHPALQNAGDSGGGAAADVHNAAVAAEHNAAADPDGDPKPEKHNFLETVKEDVQAAWSNHKGLIIGVGTGLVLLSLKPVRKRLGMK